MCTGNIPKANKQGGDNMLLHYWRISNKMTQQQLSKELGISQGTLSKIETDYFTPSFETAKRISEYTKVPIGKLFPKYNI